MRASHYWKLQSPLIPSLRAEWLEMTHNLKTSVWSQRSDPPSPSERRFLIHIFNIQSENLLDLVHVYMCALATQRSFMINYLYPFLTLIFYENNDYFWVCFNENQVDFIFVWSSLKCNVKMFSLVYGNVCALIKIMEAFVSAGHNNVVMPNMSRTLLISSDGFRPYPSML